MMKDSKHAKSPQLRKSELEHQYREIGISAVAAAARYQRVAPASKRARHMQARNSRANGDASLRSVKIK
jgi:hypothetical protein